MHLEIFTESDLVHLEHALSKLGIPPRYARDGIHAAHPLPVALGLAKLGFRVMPTWVKSKVPCVKGWPELATTDPRQIARWQRKFNPNWSILTGRENGVIVLDVDGEQGRADFARLESELGPVPSTWRYSSGRVDGGFHILLRPPPGTDDLKNQQGIPGYKLDVRGFHGFATISGSLHKSRTRYAWAPGCSPDEIELAECPPGWWAWLPKRNEAAASSRSKSTPSTRRASGVKRKQHDPASEVIGDGEGAGGFNRPIRVRCCQYWARGGTDARADEFKEVLRDAILKADASNHTPEQVARYASDKYLTAELASARNWINSQAE